MPNRSPTRTASYPLIGLLASAFLAAVLGCAYAVSANIGAG